MSATEYRQPPRLLIFDSGVGGLSILTEIQRNSPECQLIFASDNAAYPYGTKTEAQLLERLQHVLGQLIDRYAPDLLVLACNSASTLALPALRRRFSLPIVGVVPAIKPAVLSSRSRAIGLLATPGTVARAYTQQLIRDFAGDCDVHLLGSTELVHMAEQKLRGQTPNLETLRQLLAPLLHSDDPTRAIDTVVLACTHFPLLTAECEQVSPKSIHWLDSGAAVARRVADLLQQLPKTSASSTHKADNLAIFTREDKDLAQLTPRLQQLSIPGYRVLPIPYPSAST